MHARKQECLVFHEINVTLQGVFFLPNINFSQQLILTESYITSIQEKEPFVKIKSLENLKVALSNLVSFPYH